MNYTFLPEAEDEYLQAVQYLEAQAVGLGARLISEFEQQMALVCERPDSWKKVHAEGIYRKDLRVFPFSVFYRILGGVPQITAFAHHRRAPGYWNERIGS